MPFDPSKIERIAPDYWRNSQLSVVRFSSGCTINGTAYVLDHDTDYLVRKDIWLQEIMDKAKQARVAKAERRKWENLQQEGLF